MQQILQRGVYFVGKSQAEAATDHPDNRLHGFPSKKALYLYILGCYASRYRHLYLLPASPEIHRLPRAH